MATFSPPTKMDYSAGSTEQKMDMTLDDIIKHSKKGSGKKPRIPIKNRYQKTNGPAARAALQKSVASRSSGMRQGKFAEARSRSGGASFPVTRAAGKKAFAAPVNTRSRQIMKSSETARRNGFSRMRSSGLKLPNTYAAGAGKMKISVINDTSKNGAARPAIPFRRRNAAPVANRQVTAAVYNGPQVRVDFNVQQKPRTLDSLFASIRNSAPPQPFVAQGPSRRRGGGRRRPAA